MDEFEGSVNVKLDDISEALDSSIKACKEKNSIIKELAKDKQRLEETMQQNIHKIFSFESKIELYERALKEKEELIDLLDKTLQEKLKENSKIPELQEQIKEKEKELFFMEENSSKFIEFIKDAQLELVNEELSELSIIKAKLEKSCLNERLLQDQLKDKDKSLQYFIDLLEEKRKIADFNRGKEDTIKLLEQQLKKEMAECRAVKKQNELLERRTQLLMNEVEEKNAVMRKQAEWLGIQMSKEKGLISLIAQSMKELKESFKDQVESMENDHFSEIEELKKSHALEMSRLNELYNLEMVKTVERYEMRSNSQAQMIEYEKENEDLMNKYRQQLVTIKKLMKQLDFYKSIDKENVYKTIDDSNKVK